MKLESPSPFSFDATGPLKLVASAGERLLGLKKLNDLYLERREGMTSRAFLRYILDVLGVNYTVVRGGLESIPKTGPVIVVANHPFGAIEGVVLPDLLLKRRRDVKILANEYLHRISELSDLFIGVDVFGGNDATHSNMQGIKQALRQLKQGGVLVVFPAGEVSTIDKSQKQVTDGEWNRIIGMLIRKTTATTLPVYIEGKNSPLFHLAGMVHSRFRTMLLAREVLNKRKKTLRLHLGEPIDIGEMKSLKSDSAITQYVRLNTYLMASYARARKKQQKHNIRTMAPIAPAIDKALLQADVDNIQSDCLLVGKDDLQVYCAPASRISNVLQEIGRLREITFREVGEGTCMSTDLDEYDDKYLHLFIWNRGTREIAGAYRLGLVDRLMEKSGTRGLYSRSLFHYKNDFVESMGPAIEMGRSFIVSEYQRSLTSLLLLWKGIATYAYRNPRYTTLFGPVSISSEYSELSRSLMSSFLEVHHYDQDRSLQVKPTNPQKRPRKIFWTTRMLFELADSQLISRLIYRMEGDKGLPILIRQYLSLNGRLVCFNVDRDFNDALDGMIIVNLMDIPERVLGRYMGKAEAKEFLARKDEYPAQLVANQ